MVKKIEREQREGVDYAAAADAFAGRLSSASDSEVDPDEEAFQSASNVDSEIDSDEEGFQNASDVDSDESEQGDEDASEVVEDEPDNDTMMVPTSSDGEQCTFDLHNLLAVNSHQMDTTKLYSNRKSKSKKEENITIPPTTALDVEVNEDYLLKKASDGCTQLLAALWQLPTEKSDAGPMVSLPLFDSSKIPRALPPPPPKKETKWDKFAKERGIPQNKNKRSRKVFDEASGTWMFRHGYQKANDSSKEWPIMEVKGNEDPYEDPWERMREAKLGRNTKNMENRMRNVERAGNLPKGTTTRILKSREKIRQAGKAGGNLDRDNVPPSGVPVDLPARKASGSVKPDKRGKVSTTAALVAAQRSTASLGKFDKIVEGEPERKHTMAGPKKRKYESATDKKFVASESERTMKLFKSVVEGGGAEKEKARKKGQLAKGETAYDYDFDDGLGAASFRKKKGRAGAGKMRKMTKKRIK